VNSDDPLIRQIVLQIPEVESMLDLRRSTILFSQDQPADSIYYLEEGLAKMTRTNAAGDHIILAIRGRGDLIGEELLASDEPRYQTEVEILTPANVYRIPRKALRDALANRADWGLSFVSYVLQCKLVLARKVELLCLHDVEYRVLHFLADLADLVKPAGDGSGSQIPITQLELADLVGATRETTSTTLNQLERKGLIKLSRRMLTVPSRDVLLSAARARSGSASRPNPDETVPVSSGDSLAVH
jgi:CRP/FNR family transcriptional regulator, cyclic AMP receptor protein